MMQLQLNISNNPKIKLEFFSRSDSSSNNTKDINAVVYQYYIRFSRLIISHETKMKTTPRRAFFSSVIISSIHQSKERYQINEHMDIKSLSIAK